MVMKTCPKCGRSLPATTEFFYHRSNTRDGLQVWCKACAVAAAHSYYKDHKEQEVTRIRAYRETHRKEAATYSRAYYKTHKEQAAANNQAWCDAHKEERTAYNRVWRQRNRGRLTEHNRQRLQANPKLRLNQSLACMVRYSLRGGKGSRHWEDLVGYTLEDLRRHLETRFQPGMAFDNFGAWHVDHFRPIASFIFSSPDDAAFKECWSLSNLQPLWATDNHHKGARWTKEITA